MPLIQNNPWLSAAGAGQEGMQGLGEILMRVPQIRAQAAMMQQQMLMEQQKMADERAYHQGMLGYQNRSLDMQQPNIASEIALRNTQAGLLPQQFKLDQQKATDENSYRTGVLGIQQGQLGLEREKMGQMAPEILARTGLLNAQVAETAQKTAQEQKMSALAELFGQAQRKSMKLPTYNSYQGGPTMANDTALNEGNLVQAIATLQAMRPQGDPMNTAMQLQARQQQGQLSPDQMNALITGGHINTPHPESLGFNLGPGQNRYSPAGALLVQGPPPLPHAATRDTRDQMIRDVANRMAQQNSDSPTNASWGQILDLTNKLSTAQAPQQMPTVKTKEEFDKLPSGTKYIGPSGKVATKP